MKVFRKLKQNWNWFLINLVGLSAAVACLVIIVLYTRQELRYDRFHSKSDLIYRVTTDNRNGSSSFHPARVAGNWTEELMNEYPAIEKMVRLVPFRRGIIKIGDQKFYSQQAYATDSSFFDLFDFKILAGNPEKAFAQPRRAFISKSIALKYFGSIDVIGHEMMITHQQVSDPVLFTIDGVMEDFPANSHFHAEILTSFFSPEERTSWAYTYFLLKRGTNVNDLRQTIQKNWEDENQDKNQVATLHLQKLTDIHLFGHKTREMEKNGDIRSVILLISGAVIIFFIALINFLNLSRVQFIAEIKSVKVKLVNGATKKIVARDFLAESLITSTISLGVGLLFASAISRRLGYLVFQQDNVWTLIIFASGFILSIGMLSVYPVFTSGIIRDIKVSSSQGRLYSIPLVFQFSLAVITITGTFVLNRQMNFLTIQHPEAENANLMVIANNPWNVVQRYERLKDELIKSHAILGVASAMEEPGGDILDRMQFEMEGVGKTENQSLNILTIDSSFFNMMGIHALAGTTESGTMPPKEWEDNAFELSMLRQQPDVSQHELTALERKLGNYRQKYFLNESALKMVGIVDPTEAVGKRFRLNFSYADLFPEGEIIGVVPDFHYTNLYTEEQPLVIVPKMFFNYCFLIQINPDIREEAIKAIHNTWSEINPEYPLEYEFITDTYRKVYATEYSQAQVLSLFALISVILAVLGIFSMTSFSMQRRIKEIGIRKVNGARVSEILTMLNRDFVKWVVIAFVIATPVTWYAMHKWLENFAYKTMLSWWIFALAGLLALGIALLTVSWQSWKAATRNPVEALRYE